ncbi:23S rRNA (uracil(1939)-C(5))-methyltransferase RlmD [bacterium]|nr:23S rRNA (uracil(1939)-C(5))-methyltransferase RlmD [bacterium]
MADSLSVGDLVNLEIHDFAMGGEAVGRVGNFVLFIPGGAPGDEAEVRITELKKNYGRARINRLTKSSPRRVHPRCPIYNECGGCHLQHIDYDLQLQLKTKMVADALQHIAGLSGVKVRPCKRMKNPWNYRSKAQVVVGAKPYLKREKDGIDENEPKLYFPYIGYYAKGTHSIVRADSCAIQHSTNNSLLSAAREALERLQWPIYNNESGEGAIRYLVARTGVYTNQSLLVIVSTQPTLPHVPEFVELVRKRVPSLSGIVLNLNPHRTNVILSNRNSVLWGKDHIIEDVGGLKFNISANSFFQVNISGLEAIYSCLDEFLKPQSRDIVLDAYCGVGSLALYMARKVKKVIGIDECQAAIEDAVVNSDLNGLVNTDFIDGTVERVLPNLSSKGSIFSRGTHFSSAILDPPRKGCDPIVLNTIANMRIPKLVYVSCNPSTLARDLGILTEKGYKVMEVQPIDMFPQTYHVETVVKLTRAGL